jgi:tripartite ATP-independent transporter DctP family solute receptor
MDGLIRERTGGRLNIHVLGKDDQDLEQYTIAQLRNRALDMPRVNLATFNSTVSSTVILSLPFLFKSKMQLRRVLDGPVGDEILADLEHRGLVGLCFYDTGARSYYSSKKPIRNVRDMKDLKVRVQAADKSADMVRAMGAEPIPMPFDRIRVALEADVIDAAADNWPSYLTSRLYEAAKYYSPTEHNMAPGVLLFSKRVWDMLMAKAT